MNLSGASPLGILAGGGRLPLEVARAVLARGRRVHVVALEGEADPWVDEFPHTWVNWGGIGAMVEGFRQAGCKEIVILGNVRRPNLRKIRPDLGFFLALPGLIKMLKGGDDSVLRRVVHMFEIRGLLVRGVHEVAPGFVAPAGALGTVVPGSDARAAIELGREFVSLLGPFDLGQAVVATQSGIVEIEGAEGTDAMLRRLVADGTNRTSEPRVLVKAPKPDQEIRIDMPTIGLRTVELAMAAGLAGIAMESGAVLIADKAETVHAADEAGLFLYGAEVAAERGSTGSRDRGPSLQGVADFRPAGRRQVRQMDREDARIGVALLAAIRPYWGDGAVVVSRGYVLAVEKPEQSVRALERARRNKPWGMGLLKRGVGVLVTEASYCTEDLLQTAGLSGFAAVALAGLKGAGSTLVDLVAVADEAGIGLLMPCAEDAR